MENKQPLLSICIPTYNRAEALRKNLTNIVRLEGFDDDVEIIISDNCSTDNTQEVVEYFSLKHPNIKYFRNAKNINDSNFSTALDHATGEYIKLLNDNALILPEGLIYLKEIVITNRTKRIPIFFTDNQIFTKKKESVIVCSDLNEYIEALSAFITAISCFGAWNEQWAIVNERTKYTEYKLNQVDWAFQIVSKFNGCILYDQQYYRGFLPGIRKGYNWFDVHINNFYKIMQPYIDKGLIDKKTVKIDKINHLYHFKPEIFQIFFYPWRAYWQYDTTDSFKILWSHYKTYPYFYWLMITAPFWGTWSYIILPKVVKPFLNILGLYEITRKIIKRKQ